MYWYSSNISSQGQEGLKENSSVAYHKSFLQNEN